MLRSAAQSGLLALCLTLFLPTHGSAQATTDDQRRDDGFRLNSVGASIDYFTQAIPVDIHTFEDVFLGSSSAGSASVNLSARKTTGTGLFSLQSYSVYSMRRQGETSKGWNEALVGGMLKRVRRWSFQWYGNAAIMNFDESLFANSTMASLAATSLTFPEMVDAVSGDPGVAATASGGRFEPDSSPGRFLLGRRTASYGGQASLGYSTSRRMTLDVTAGMSSIRRINGDEAEQSAEELDAKSLSVGTNLSLQFSRDTSLGVGGQVNQSRSTLSEVMGRAVSTSINHAIGKHFVVEGSIGWGSTSGPSAANDTIYSGGGGVLTNSMSFMGTYRKSVNSLYSVALGQDSSFFSATTASWHYSPRRATWYVQSSYSHYRDQPARKIFKLPAPTSWLSQITMGRQMGAHLTLSGMYSIGRTGARRYVQDGRQYKLEQNAARITVAWSPRADPIRNRDR